LKAFLELKRSDELKDSNDEIMYNPLVARNRKDLELLYNDKIVLVGVFPSHSLVCLRY
jgi:hypothetical protein